MPTRFTSLSTLITRMDTWRSISTLSESSKVRFIDTAVRELRRTLQPPWVQKKTTIKVFKDVLLYPTADDHGELADIDNQSKDGFADKARFRFTSLKEFYENPDSRNDLAEIWDQNTKYLGIRYEGANLDSVKVSSAESVTGYTYSGDVTAVTLDTVIFDEGSASVRVSITNSSGVATVENTAVSHSDTNYKRKYYFRAVYLDSVPTSVQLKYGTDSTNYLHSTVTTQFSGQAFKADDWNILAFDLNEATEEGTIDSTSFAYESVVLNGAETGEYRLDASYLRGWTLMDYWYYSINNVATVSTANASLEYFFNDTTNDYDSSNGLVGDPEWADVIMYEAMLLSLSDLENTKLFNMITKKKEMAWSALEKKYPSLEPLITTQGWRFASHGNLGVSDDNYCSQR